MAGLFWPTAAAPDRPVCSSPPACSAIACQLWRRLLAAARERLSLAQDWQAPAVHFDALLHHGPAPAVSALAQAIARRPGPIIGIQALASGDTAVAQERLVI